MYDEEDYGKLDRIISSWQVIQIGTMTLRNTLELPGSIVHAQS